MASPTDVEIIFGPIVVPLPGGSGRRSVPMAQLLSIRNPPTAVFAQSDEVAVGAVRTLRRTGLQVLEDVSIISIDDHPIAELTTLDVAVANSHALLVRSHLT